MKVKLLGYKHVNFTKPEDGSIIAGTKIFVGIESAIGDKDNFGIIPSNVWVAYDNQEILTIDPAKFIGKIIDVEYNEKGKAVAISA